ncbi:hypothetical protein HZI73_26365 (plasmid) [Vallitalea pronyensis]|uniref:Uncharacterized protein n=1 Tax=Vallitalea pronyensis TaxID=1348613 RepID=A0A8J8MQE1_9FIRM|nr:hypothetical protein [Vallitalea pronyensis]QUI25940.1 hypothetical protein HZI73_26365 [Vallitalea pronyensis]
MNRIKEFIESINPMAALFSLIVLTIMLVCVVTNINPLATIMDNFIEWSKSIRGIV